MLKHASKFFNFYGIGNPRLQFLLHSLAFPLVVKSLMALHLESGRYRCIAI